MTKEMGLPLIGFGALCTLKHYETKRRSKLKLSRLKFQCVAGVSPVRDRMTNQIKPPGHWATAI
jgi:hypothetical protein